MTQTKVKYHQIDGAPVNVKDFGAKGDGVTDDTAAIQEAIDTVETGTSGPKTLYFPVGVYKITNTLIMTRGTVLQGEGTTGSTVGYGTYIKHAVNNGIALLWNGNDSTGYIGTGGALRHINIVKADTFSGGDAIKLQATDDSHRPGEFAFEDVLVLGEGAATWARGIHVDGTASTTPGSKGVRSVYFNKVRIADTTSTGQSIYLNQAVHVYGNFAVDQGTGTNPGVTIAGDSENINLWGIRVGGTFTILDPTTDGTCSYNISGIITTSFNNDNEDAYGVVSITSTNTAITNNSPNLKIICPTTDAFRANKTTATTNITGDNTPYTIVYDSEVYDKNNSFDHTTGIFTCKTAGLYEFNGYICLLNLGAAHTRHDSAIVHKNSSATVLGSYGGPSNPYAQGSNSGAQYSFPLSVLLQVNEGDTVHMQANVSGSTKTVTVYGQAVTSGQFTYFSGKLIA